VEKHCRSGCYTEGETPQYFDQFSSENGQRFTRIGARFRSSQNFCAKKKLIINQLRLFFENNFPKSLVRWNRNYTFAAAFRKPRFLEEIFRKIYLDII
jgi:hypothetical protein